MATRVLAYLAALGLLVVLTVASVSGGLLVGVVAMALVIGLTLALGLGPTRFGTVLIILAIFFGPMSKIRPVPSITFITISDVFLVGGMVLLLPAVLQRNFRLPPIYQIGAGILFVSGTIASLGTPSPLTSMRYLIQLMIAMLVLPSFIAWWGPGPTILRRLALAYVYGQAVSVLLAVPFGNVGNGRYEGLTTHPNFFGLCSVLAMGLTLYLIPRSSQQSARLLIALDLLFFLAVVMSGSRAALLAVAVMALVWVVVERSAMGGFALVTLGLCALALGNVLLSLAPSGSALARLAGDATAVASDNARTDLIQTGLSTVQDHPVFGTGFENALHSHSIFLEIAVAAGVVGLLGYVLMLIAFLQPLLERGNRLHALAYPVLGYVLVGALSNSLWDRFIWTAAALGAMAMSHGHSAEEDEDTADATPAPPAAEAALSNPSGPAPRTR